MNGTIEILERRFGARLETLRRGDLAFVTVPADRAAEGLAWMRDGGGFTHLVMISCVDWIERGAFRLLYLLNSPAKRCDIGLYVDIPRDAPSMESVHRLWAGAKTYQRELREMFGIDFPGSPGVDDPMILEGWHDIPPMRRDFDTLAYAERTFYPREGRETRDPAADTAERVYPRDEALRRGIADLARRTYGDRDGNGES